MISKSKVLRLTLGAVLLLSIAFGSLVVLEKPTDDRRIPRRRDLAAS